MIRRTALTLFATILLLNPLSGLVFAQGLTVLSPLGQPPAIAKVPMAPRLDTMDGKTVYIVDIGFTDTHHMFTIMADLLGERYPNTKFEVRLKIGTYFDDDPDLWAEIKEKGDAMIIGVGH